VELPDQLFRLAQTLERTAERLLDIVDEMHRKGIGNGGGYGSGNPRVRHKRGSPGDRMAAGKGVRRLLIDRHADGFATVVIGEGGELELSPALVDLLEILAEETGNSVDHLVGHKSLGNLTSALSKKQNKPLTRGAVRQRISRLREELAKHGMSPRLVDTSRDGGYRFNLRRGGEPFASSITREGIAFSAS
jgi:hypothetical protein